MPLASDHRRSWLLYIHHEVVRQIIMRGIRMFGPRGKPHEGILGGKVRRVVHSECEDEKKEEKREMSGIMKYWVE